MTGPNQKTKRSRVRRFLYVGGILVLVIAGSIGAGLAVVPGGMSQLHLVRRPPPVRVVPAGVQSAPLPAADAGEQKLYLTYVVPTGLLQREVGALFPIAQGVEGLLELVLSNPRFVADPDGRYLRLTVDLAVTTMGAKTGAYPGTAIVRTQLRFDGATDEVSLANAELAEFSFSGSAAPAAESLRPVLQDELAAEMNGYVVFKLPKDAGWWMRSGVSFVQDVVVENGQVVVVIGR